MIAPGPTGDSVKRKRLRILFLTAESWPTYRVDVSVLFGRLLPRVGITSDLVTMRAAEGDEEWGGGTAKLSGPANGRIELYLRSFWHYLRELLRARWVDYDAVQVRDLPLPAAIALLFARWHHRPFFYWMSYPIPEGQMELAKERGLDAGLIRYLYPWVRGRFGRFLLYSVVLPRADHVFVQSDRMKEDLIKCGVNRERMTPVPMGVDISSIASRSVWCPIATQLKNCRSIVYLGTLDRARRVEILFEVLALLQPTFPDICLVMVGDTEDQSQRTRLRRMASEAGVEKQVIWTGWLPMEEAWGYVANCEVGLSPIPRGAILDVSSPTKLVEYLAVGVPVVCNDNPDQAQVIAACGAGRCVEYTASAFAAAVRDLLELDIESRRAMISKGRAYVAKYRDYPVLASNLGETYRVLCDGLSSSSGTKRESEATTR